MDSLVQYASIEDVICAFDMILEHDTTDVMITKIFGLDNALSMINFGCIKNSDHVFVMTYDYEIITGIISYLYMPNRLIANTMHSVSKINNMIDNFHLLLAGYQYTKPVITDLEIDCKENSEEPFDVMIVGLIDVMKLLTDKPRSRFYLEIGEDYELFEKHLIKTSVNLKDGGILVILTKPGWILKGWHLLKELNLQLEYHNYKLYIDSNRDANTLVWLRFVKKINDIDQQFNKKNIMDLMSDNNIDRLFAHKNNLLFPYVELPIYDSEAFINLNQNVEYMQYFFTLETTKKLSELCDSYTACLVTPSVAQCAHRENKNVVLFERDNRFRENGGLKFVKYDLSKGLTKLLYNKYLHKFDKVICDPPFNIKLDILSNDINELLKRDKSSIAYIIFPYKEKARLVNAMKWNGLYLVDEHNQISIEYAKPPKIVRLFGKEAIQLFKFSYRLVI